MPFLLGVLIAYLVAGVATMIASVALASPETKRLQHYRINTALIIPFWPGFMAYVFRAYQESYTRERMGFGPDTCMCNDPDPTCSHDEGCDGSATCPAWIHIHGCYADLGNCEMPSEHHG